MILIAAVLLKENDVTSTRYDTEIQYMLVEHSFEIAVMLQLIFIQKFTTTKIKYKRTASPEANIFRKIDRKVQFHKKIF